MQRFGVDKMLILHANPWWKQSICEDLSGDIYPCSVSFNHGVAGSSPAGLATVVSGTLILDGAVTAIRCDHIALLQSSLPAPPSDHADLA